MSTVDELYGGNILDAPDQLELVEENDYEREEDDDEAAGRSQEDKENTEKKTDEKKKRKQIQRPKLNIIRLMSDKGLTSIEKNFEDITFKGKGYEKQDLNLIMRKMEIWTHQLFPSLQFDECLAKLEKVGNNKSVMTYVKKIRMGLEDEVQTQLDGDEENELQNDNITTVSNDSLFDNLLDSSNNRNASQTTPSAEGLTQEQKERMVRNRLIAEQRLMAKMKARQEQLQNTSAEQTQAEVSQAVPETLPHVSPVVSEDNLWDNSEILKSDSASNLNIENSASQETNNITAVKNIESVPQSDCLQKPEFINIKNDIHSGICTDANVLNENSDVLLVEQMDTDDGGLMKQDCVSPVDQISNISQDIMADNVSSI